MPEFLSLALIVTTAIVLIFSTPAQGDNFIIAALCGFAILGFLLSF